jgi:putative transposase
MLADKIEYYNNNKSKLNNTPAQYKNEFVWLKEVDSLALANAQMNLQTAYNNFFRDKSIGFPKFKSKHKDRKSYTTNCVNGNIQIQDKQIKLPKLGLVNVKFHRQIPRDSIIKSCTISQTPTGKYYISILTEYKDEIIPIEVNANNIIGLDMDMKNLFTDSQGNKAEYPRYYRQMQDKLAREQRKLSKCVKGSNNYNKQKLIVAKLHEKVANQRRDFLHKLSNQIAKDYDAVCIEDLNMRAMGQCLHLGKSVADNGWGMFTTFMGYKLNWQGKLLIKINKWFPSSKMCNVCGTINDNLTLADREWTCEGCNTHHNRDWNAAINIKNEGIKLIIEQVA